MKWTSYILTLVIIYLVCTARTCNEDESAAVNREEQYIMSLKDSVKNVFMSDSLSDQLLRAYEISAAEKLNDFADYMKIISDTTLNLKFRQHAAELAKGLFVTDKIELHNWSKTYPQSDLYTLGLLLSYSLSEGISCWINPMQINVTKPLVNENDSTFIGNLSIMSNCVPFNNKDTSEIVSGELVVDIYLVKKFRYFGNERIRAWNVYLGDIN
jgi:hypothetical protein